MPVVPRRWVLSVLAIAVAAPLQGQEYKPRLEAEGRWFHQAEGAPVTGSVAGTLETFHEWDERRQRLVGEFFARYDGTDDSRTHGDVRELYYQTIGDDFEFRLGARRVYWGVTESRHLVDIINQTDFVEDIDAESKLGQPMMNLALIRDYGTLDIFLMPYQRARTFPGVEGYPRLPFEVQEHEALYESRREQRHLDGALRYVNSFGPVDLGLAWFDGTAREPRLLPCLRRGSGFQGTQDGPNCDILSGIVIPQSPFPDEFFPVLQAAGLAPSDEEIAGMQQEIEANIRRNIVLVPFYDRLRQFSVDAQFVIESLAVKLEALGREQQDRTTYAAVTGFEYTFGDIGGSGTDIGVLAEYLFDEKDDFLATLYDDELFVGSRLALSDVAGTQVLAGVIANRENFRNRLYGLEASRRLGDDWRLALEARFFSRLPRGEPVSFLADQDFVTVTLERFF